MNAQSRSQVHVVDEVLVWCGVPRVLVLHKVEKEKA